MSNLSIIVRKKNLKGKTTHEVLSKETALPDISKYLVKQADSSEVDCAEDANVFVPCPDDAALPSSTCLGSVCKTPNCFVHDENDLHKSSKSVSASSDIGVKSSVENNVNTSNTAKRKNKKPTLVARNSQITDFFPVRRSNRKTSVYKMTERNQIIEDAIISGKEEGFQITEFPDKGRGVITNKAIKRGEFVLEYYGELINYEEAKRREGIYSDKENIGCYMFYFKHRNKQYCVDATKETGRLGRLVNHSKKGNLRSRTFLIQETPHLVLFASKDIQLGEELCYDYGDRRKAALESHPWLAA